MKLNTSKCVAIAQNTGEAIKYINGEELTIVQEALYLGSNINSRVAIKREVQRRTMAQWLHGRTSESFGKKAECSTKNKTKHIQLNN